MKLWLLLSFIPVAVFAQNFRAMPRLQPILPRLDQPSTKTQALDRLARGGPIRLTPGTPVASQTCSVPLVTIRPRDYDPHMIVPARSNVEPGLRDVTPPAPSCADPQVR